jgi:hypothetical protein
MQGLKIGNNISLVFTKVMDEMTRGAVDEDEDAEAAQRTVIIGKIAGQKGTVHLADQLLEIAREYDPSLEMKYNRFYIGLSKDGQPYNFVIFRPQKNTVRIELKLTRTDDMDKFIESTGLETLEYNTRNRVYRLSLKKEDFTQKREQIKQLIETAYKNWTA